jgi:hypothetical protein
VPVSDAVRQENVDDVPVSKGMKKKVKRKEPKLWIFAASIQCLNFSTKNSCG